MAKDAADNFVVVWTGPDPVAGNCVFGQRYDGSGLPLGPEFIVSVYTLQQAGQRNLPSVFSDPSGNFVVVWASAGLDGAGLGVVGQRYAASGAPLGPAFVVNSFTAGDQFDPDVIGDASGNFVVVWRDFQPPLPRVLGQRFASSGAPLGQEFTVASVPSGSPQPAVAADPAGNFVVTWSRIQAIDAQRYSSSGAPLGTVFQVSQSTTSFNKFAPAVASDSSGNFVVAWETWYQDGDYAGVFARRYGSSGAPFGPEFRVNTYTTSGQGIPSVAIDATGNFVVVWASGFQDGSFAGVFGQRFASSGVALGTEFRVNTYTTSTQTTPSVAANAAGNFVVVWDSYYQDGSLDGVFGQRYNMIVPVELMHFRVE